MHYTGKTKGTSLGETRKSTQNRKLSFGLDEDALRKKLRIFVRFCVVANEWNKFSVRKEKTKREYLRGSCHTREILSVRSEFGQPRDRMEFWRVTDRVVPSGVAFGSVKLTKWPEVAFPRSL